MKTIATCKPSEFLRQTNRLRKSVEKWMRDVDIINIRKRVPVFDIVPKDATQEQKEEIVKSNKDKADLQAIKNVNDILDAALDKYPDQTLELLALCCFVEPEDVDNHIISEYLDAFSELMNNKSVISFFTSLVQLGQTSI